MMYGSLKSVGIGSQSMALTFYIKRKNRDSVMKLRYMHTIVLN